MRRGLLLASCLLGCVPVQPVPYQPSIPGAVFAAKNSVVTLVHIVGVRREFACSGGVIEYLGVKRIVTAAHCDSSQKLYVYQNGIVSPTELVAKKTEWYWDWMVLDSGAVKDLPFAPLGETPRIGDDVYTWHQPLGIAPYITKGIYQGRILPSVAEERPIFLAAEILEMQMVSFMSAAGASGSLVFNRGGEAIGVISAEFKLSDGNFLPSVLIVDVPRT